MIELSDLTASSDCAAGAAHPQPAHPPSAEQQLSFVDYFRLTRMGQTTQVKQHLKQHRLTSDSCFKQHFIDREGYSLLHWAVLTHDFELIRILIEDFGLDVNARTPHTSQTALMWYLTVMNSFSADNAQSPSQNLPRKILQFLLDHNADIHAQDSLGATALIISIQHNCEDGFFLLIGHDETTIYGRDSRGCSTLHWAAFQGAESMMKVLLHLDISSTEDTRNAKFPVVDSRSATRSNVNECNSALQSKTSTSSSSKNIVKSFLPNLVDNEGMTAVHRAMLGRQILLAERLIETGLMSDEAIMQKTYGNDHGKDTAKNGSGNNEENCEEQDVRENNSPRTRLGDENAAPPTNNEDEQRRDILQIQDAADVMGLEVIRKALHKTYPHLLSRDASKFLSSGAAALDQHCGEDATRSLQGTRGRNQCGNKLDCCEEVSHINVDPELDSDDLKEKSALEKKDDNFSALTGTNKQNKPSLFSSSQRMKSTIVSLYELYRKMFKKTKPGPFLALSYGFCQLAFIFWFFPPTYTGSSSSSQQEESNIKEEQHFLLTLLSFLAKLLSSTAVILLMKMFIQPNAGEIAKERNGRNAIAKHIRNLKASAYTCCAAQNNYNSGENQNLATFERFCDTCFILRDFRTKHCRSCDMCIEEFDHHCIWINNCIGKNNHRTFVAFLLTCTTGGFLSLLVSIWKLRLCLSVVVEEMDNYSIKMALVSQEEKLKFISEEVSSEGVESQSSSLLAYLFGLIAHFFSYFSINIDAITFDNTVHFLVAFLQNGAHHLVYFMTVACGLYWLYPLLFYQLSAIGENLTTNERMNKHRYGHLWTYEKTQTLGGIATVDTQTTERAKNQRVHFNPWQEARVFRNPWDKGSRRKNCKEFWITKMLG